MSVLTWPGDISMEPWRRSRASGRSSAPPRALTTLLRLDMAMASGPVMARCMRNNASRPSSASSDVYLRPLRTWGGRREGRKRGQDER